MESKDIFLCVHLKYCLWVE